jgi:hypothetical protein
MATTVQPKTTSVTITTGGTPEQVIADKTLIRTIIFQASSSNAAPVYVGDSAMTTAASIELIAGNSVSVEAPDMGKAGSDDLDLSDFYVDGTNGDTVRIVYLERA